MEDKSNSPNFDKLLREVLKNVDRTDKDGRQLSEREIVEKAVAIVFEKLGIRHKIVVHGR